MPTLEFKGKQHIYAHHLIIPYRPLEIDATKSYTYITPPLLNPTKTAPATQPIPTITLLSMATTCMPSKHYSRAMPTVSSASTSTHRTTPATKTGYTTTT